MDWVNQNRFKSGLIVGLLALNIITVSIIWMQTARTRPVPPREQAPRSSESANLMKQALDMNEEQTKQLEKILAGQREESREYSNRLTTLKRELAEMVFQANPDTSLAQAKVAEIGTLQSKVEMIRFQHFQEVLSICTPEQREELKPIALEVFGRKPPRDESWEKKPPRELQEKREERQPREQSVDNTRRVTPSRPRDGAPAPPSVEEKLAKYSQRLGLSDEQLQSVRGVLQRTREQSEDLRKKRNPDRDEIESQKARLRKEEDESIMKLLTEQQKGEFERMRANRRN